MTVSSPGRAVGTARERTAPSPAAVSSAPALGAVSPSRAEFRELAALHRVIPVTRRLLADDETPVGVYRKLAGDRPGTFLFESAENGRSWSRWSFVGTRSTAVSAAADRVPTNDQRDHDRPFSADSNRNVPGRSPASLR